MKLYILFIIIASFSLRAADTTELPSFSPEKAIDTISRAVKDTNVVVGVFTGKQNIDFDSPEFNNWLKKNPLNPESGLVLITPVKILKGAVEKYIYVKGYYKRFGMDAESYRSFLGIESSRYILLLKKSSAGGYYDLVDGFDAIVAIRDVVPLEPNMLPHYNYLYTKDQFDLLVDKLGVILAGSAEATIPSP